ncbi:MAG: 4-alpha-glucanotransferase, partial [Vulcanimicrobiota bacterium]
MPTKTEEIANKDPMLNLNKPFEEAFKPLPTYQAWKKIGFTPRFGVLIPLASIRSRHNFGVGEFGDITIFKEFCKSIGSTIIQLLPLNDMGRSKVPYSSISAFALDPVYISLKDIDEFKYPSDDLKHYLEENWHIIEEEKNSKYINYEKIRIFKFGALFKLFWDFVNRNSYNGSHRWHQFQSFIRNNEYWLEDYAVFRTLK